jgi:integrase
MIQQGQVFKLKAKGPDGQPLWAYRYRLEGRGSERPQVGGFATRAEAEKALRKIIDRLGPGGGRATITLAEFVEEYLEMHQAAPVTIAKLRWLLDKATAELGSKRLADLSPRDVCAWRMTIPEGHRFEATQALRQVLNRAVCWRLLDFNPAKVGVPNPPRRAKEKRPFETWRQIEAVAAQLGLVYGPMISFTAATGLRPSELFGLEQRDVDRRLGVVYVRRAYANGRLKHTKTRLSTRAVPLQAKALEALDRLPASNNPNPLSEHARWTDRLPDLRTQALAAGTKQGRHRSDPRSLRPAPHLRHLRSPRRRAGVRGLTLHGHEHRHDRPPLRPSRQRQPRARRRASGCARVRADGGRCVDVDAHASEASQEDGCGLSNAPAAPPRGRPADAAPRFRRLTRRRKELISSDEAKPPRGLEPRTPSLPFLSAFHLSPVVTGCARWAP